MKIPGCLVALLLVPRLRATGMDALGYMLDKDGADPDAQGPVAPARQAMGRRTRRRRAPRWGNWP